MARPLFEQYKDALRRGHVALLGDELEAALTAYREAAAFAPDRPLPHASIGGVLERLGRADEALVAYDLALALAPDDAAVAAARAGLGASIAAARLTRAANEREIEATPRAAAPAEPDRPAPTEPLASAADGDQGLDAIRATLVAEPEDAVPPPLPEVVAARRGEPVASPPAPAPGSWPAIDLPSPPRPALEGPPPDPAVLQAEADSLLDAGDEQGARDRLILAAIVHRESGRLDAAINACLPLLAVAPDDPRVHLADRQPPARPRLAAGRHREDRAAAPADLAHR